MTTLVGNVHPEFRAFWHPVAWSREVVDSPVATTLLDEPLVAVRRPTGEVAVFIDECPHRGAPLSLGRQRTTSWCARFTAGGSGPTVPPHAFRRSVLRRRSRRVPGSTRPAGVCERYGIVWVALEPPRLPIVSWPDGDDDRLGEFSPTAHTSEVLAAYQTDNLLDASHFPFLHRSLSTETR